MQYLLLHYGYAFLILGIILEGDATLVAAVILAEDAYFNLRWVIGLALGISFVANMVLYELGRRGGRRYLPDVSESRVKHWLHGNFGRMTLIFSRFMWGFRLLIPCAAGAMHIRRRLFLLCNIAGAFIWTGILVYFGVEIQAALRSLQHSLAPYQSNLAVGLFLLGLALAIGSIPRQLTRRNARKPPHSLLLADAEAQAWMSAAASKGTPPGSISGN